MDGKETIIINRPCYAIFVPLGLRVNVKEGSEVVILQELGDSYTVLLDGQMARIDAVDADALGRSRKPLPIESYTGELNLDTVSQYAWKHMKTVYDPEIPVNIVDLGLVYDCQITGSPKKGFKARVKMTLTAPGCGMGDVLVADAKSKLEAIPGLKAEVELVLDPPWSQDMMSEVARLETGLL